MREKLLQLLPEIGDPGVQQSEKPRKPYAFDRHTTCTPLHGAGAQGAQDDSDMAIAHQTENEVCSRKANKINTGSPCTPCTPFFAQDFTEDMEERAAIMEFDGGMTRQEAEAAAFADCKQPLMNGIGRHER